MNFIDRPIQIVKQKPWKSFFAFILSISIFVAAFFGVSYLKAAPVTIACDSGSSTKYIYPSDISSSDVSMQTNIEGDPCTIVLVQENTDSVVILHSLTIDSNVTLTHPTSTAEVSTNYMIRLWSTGDVTVLGSIDVSGKGYLGGGKGDNASNTQGRYRANELAGFSNVAGGSHGGKGGADYSDFEPYDSIKEPTSPGGGGSTDIGLAGTNPGGNGGGVIHITSETGILVNEVYADGEDSTYGAGAGGSIYLNVTTGTISAGIISANGGDSSTNGTHGGGGGGGRISLVADSVTVSASSTYGGSSGFAWGNTYAGSAGTIYVLERDNQTYGSLSMSNGGTTNTSFTTSLNYPVYSADKVDEFGYGYMFDAVYLSSGAILNISSDLASNSTGEIDWDRKFYSSQCPFDDDNLTNGEIVYDHLTATDIGTNYDFTCGSPRRLARLVFASSTDSEASSTPGVLVEMAGPPEFGDYSFYLNVKAASTTATAGDDFTTSTNVGTIAMGTTSTLVHFDVIDDHLIESSENIVFTLSRNGGGPYIVGDPDFTYTIIDNDVAGVTVNEGTGIAVTEGSVTSSFSVVLDTQPLGTVQIHLSPDEEVSLPTSTLYFTTSTWDIPQAVIVSAVDDGMTEGSHSGYISMTASSTEDSSYDDISITGSPFIVGIADDDVPGVTLDSGMGIRITEGGATTSYTMVLDSIPLSDVDITAIPGSDLEVSAPTITFTSLNWNIPQSVIISAVDDALAEGEEHPVISFSVSSSDSNYSGISVTGLGTIVTDNDIPGVTIVESDDTTIVYEPNITDSYTIVLNIEPTDNVTTALSTDADITLSTSSIVFTPTNWNVPRTVTVTPVNDSDILGRISSNITHSFSSADSGYNVLSAEVISYTKVDNDQFTVTQSSGETILAEGGATDSIEYFVNMEPSAPVILHLAVDDETVQLSTSTLYFTSSNWSDANQIVTLSVIDDEEYLGSRTANLTYTIESADTNFTDAIIATTTLSMTDNDDPPGITVSAAFGTTTESNDIFTFTVQLDTAPSSNVSIPVSTSDDTEGTANTSTLVFTPDNWGAKTVTVMGIDDAYDDGNVSYNILLGAAESSDLGYDGMDTADIFLSNTDNDTAAITATAISMDTTESGGEASFTVVLGSKPTANVTISLSSSDETEGTISPSSLTFTPSNWIESQSVTVTGVDDSESDGDIDYTIVLSAASSSDDTYNGMNPADVSVTNTDDDLAGITVSSISRNTTEAGQTATFTVVLDSQPTENVLISVTSTDATEGTASASTLTFTSLNWASAQTVTVTGIDDAFEDGNIAYSIVLSAAVSDDLSYSGINPDDVAITNNDNDTSGITVSSISGNTTEAGGTATFTVVLNSEPTANVVIPISSSDLTEGTVSTSSLTFTSLNWDQEKTVTVTGQNDDTVDGNVAYSIVLAAAVSLDDAYDGINSDDLALTNVDNDASVPGGGQGITVSSVSRNTTEVGGTATFTVVLDAEPTDDVVITLSSSDESEGTISTETLTFTTLNWDTAQTVTLTGQDDYIDDGNIAYSIVLDAATSNDADYDGINPDDIALTNTDNDTAGITVSYVAQDTTEFVGTSTFTFTVVLDSQPTADVTIAFVSSDETEGTISPESVTFTSANWDEEQLVSVTGVDDDENDGDVAYGITLAAAVSEDDVYDGINPDDISLSNIDDDDASESSGGGSSGGGSSGGSSNNNSSRGGGSSPIRRNASESGYRVTINKGKDTSNGSAVNLDFEGSDIDTVAVSNYPDFTGSTYLPFTPEMSWQLLPGPGVKTVYVRFQTSRGNMYQVNNSIEVISKLPNVSDRGNLPEGSLANCELTLNRPYKTLDSTKVYIIVEDPNFNGTGRCVKEHLPTPLYFFSYFSSWDEVESVDSAVLAAIPNMENNISILGPRFIPYNGSIVRSAEDEQPYYILDGFKYMLAGDRAFRHMGFETSWTQTINTQVLNGFKDAETITETSAWPVGLVIRFTGLSARAYQVLETTGDNKVHVKDLGLYEKLDDRFYRRDRIVQLEKNINVILPSMNIGPRVAITRFLSIGSAGNDVRYLQKKLQSLGYFTYEGATGRYGYETAQAVARFQKDHDIEAKGYVGPATRDLINSL